MPSAILASFIAKGVNADGATAKAEHLAIELSGTATSVGVGVDAGGDLSERVSQSAAAHPRQRGIVGAAANGSSVLRLNDVVINIDGSYDTAEGVEVYNSTGSVEAGVSSSTTPMQDGRISITGGSKHYPLFASGGELMVQHSERLSGSGTVSDYLASVNPGAVW